MSEQKSSEFPRVTYIIDDEVAGKVWMHLHYPAKEPGMVYRVTISQMDFFLILRILEEKDWLDYEAFHRYLAEFDLIPWPEARSLSTPEEYKLFYRRFMATWYGFDAPHARHVPALAATITPENWQTIVASYKMLKSRRLLEEKVVPEPDPFPHFLSAEARRHRRLWQQNSLRQRARLAESRWRPTSEGEHTDS